MRVFLSYRRDDDPFAVGRLRDFLAHRFGEKNVFLDVVSIRSGVNFEQVIDETIDRSDIVLVVIGARWESSVRSEGVVDYVELEVGAALRKGKQVIPVLLGQRGMPPGGGLPGALARLPSINAHRLRPDPDFFEDARSLVGAFAGSQPATVRVVSRWRGWALAASGLLIIGLFWVLASRGTRNPVASSATVSTVAMEVEMVTSTGQTGPVATPDSTTSTTISIFDLWYPTASPQPIVLTGESLDGLPQIPVRIDGYDIGRGERYDTVRIFENEPPYVPTMFSEWALQDRCADIWWVARWESANRDIDIHGSSIAADWLLNPSLLAESSVEVDGPAAHAGFVSGTGCDVLAFALDEQPGDMTSLVDVEFRVQVWDRLPSDLETGCEKPYRANERLPLVLCDKGENVRRVQEALVMGGYGSIDLDGTFGSATRSALQAFQVANGLNSDGVVTTSTWIALFPGQALPTGDTP